MVNGDEMEKQSSEIRELKSARKKSKKETPKDPVYSDKRETSDTKQEGSDGRDVLGDLRADIRVKDKLARAARDTRADWRPDRNWRSEFREVVVSKFYSFLKSLKGIFRTNTDAIAERKMEQMERNYADCKNEWMMWYKVNYYGKPVGGLQEFLFGDISEGSKNYPPLDKKKLDDFINKAFSELNALDDDFIVPEGYKGKKNRDILYDILENYFSMKNVGNSTTTSGKNDFSGKEIEVMVECVSRLMQDKSFTVFDPKTRKQLYRYKEDDQGRNIWQVWIEAFGPGIAQSVDPEKFSVIENTYKKVCKIHRTKEGFKKLAKFGIKATAGTLVLIGAYYTGILGYCSEQAKKVYEGAKGKYNNYFGDSQDTLVLPPPSTLKVVKVKDDKADLEKMIAGYRTKSAQLTKDAASIFERYVSGKSVESQINNARSALTYQTKELEGKEDELKKSKMKYTDIQVNLKIAKDKIDLMQDLIRLENKVESYIKTVNAEKSKTYSPEEWPKILNGYANEKNSIVGALGRGIGLNSDNRLRRLLKGRIKKVEDAYSGLVNTYMKNIGGLPDDLGDELPNDL
ncbi:hypothetical protein KY330_01785 [Candidatus Woesearchaeota archaeon]|nr:hypothetical protein [Candidatus Woesearchaeota archaeon]